MPKSRIRKKVREQRQHVAEVIEQTPALPSESPKWLAPTMVACFLLGLIWVVIFYISSTSYPIPSIGAWNMGIGFGFIAAGFTLATRWR
jgi:hypothetical protein